ncbi:MAG: sensor histidine kinase [Candidatus Limivicinus sp.]|jgi:two-component system sensor histidine kinase YesM
MLKSLKKPFFSLRARFVLMVLTCWVMPLVIVGVTAGVLLNSNYSNSMRTDLESSSEKAMRQIEMEVDSAVEASKAISYDGIVGAAYRDYKNDGNLAQLYATVNSYLHQSFSRDERLKAVFINFRPNINQKTFTVCHDAVSYSKLKRYWIDTEPELMKRMDNEDTGIFFVESGGELYLVRNLLDSSFQPYASVVMLCDTGRMFQALGSMNDKTMPRFIIDGEIGLSPEGSAQTLSENCKVVKGDVYLKSTSEGHYFEIYADIPDFNMWSGLPGIKAAVAFAAALVIPLLIVLIYVFHRHVTHPVETLVEAANHMQQGERGYLIDEKADNAEFDKLYRHFNSMSTELKNQFERSYMEQQALQQAKIKALQSQINPHFLNNTLEIINWESKIAGNTQVSNMIEALSTMLDAALDRNGRGIISLREELSYVEAYLYIIRERLGSRLQVEREIDEEMLDSEIPRLILQPLVENAVEHDITPRKGGKLCLRAYRENEFTVLEVQHDGSLSESDREKIKEMQMTAASEAKPSTQVGLKNVNQRLKLIYGERASFTVEETEKNSILARISFPSETDGKCQVAKEGQEKTK